MAGSTLNKRYDLGFGESVSVRKSFLEVATSPIIFDYNTLENLGYSNHFGDPRLVELTKTIIKRQTGNDYNYILITAGATGGVTIALRNFFLARGLKNCITNDPPYFRLFPSMIRAAGMSHIHGVKYNDVDKSAVFLVDSLSNPLAKFSEMKYNTHRSPIVWDSTYYGNVYAPGNHPQPEHDVLVGSYSKLTGLNGLRLGWIACNDRANYEDMKVLVAAEYCSVSAASTKIVLDTVGKFSTKNWEMFEYRAQVKLDYNREEFSKLEKFFGGNSVPKYGMFFYTEMDLACKKLLEKSSIVWSPGTDLGTNDNFGRFNIGQDVELIKKAVSTVLKNDKR